MIKKGKKMEVQPSVLIFGVTGQDGSYLTELLLGWGHRVVGVARRTSTPNLERLGQVKDDPKLTIVQGDVTDFGSVVNIISTHRPDWIFNLAAQSNVGTSFTHACSSLDITANGFVNILEAVRLVKPTIRVYQASSSEMFGDSFSLVCKDDRVVRDIRGTEKIQNLETPFNPQSPYAIAKLAAHKFGQLYRKAYGMDIRMGILFNHESERRGEDFVTRKITKWIGQYSEWRDQFKDMYFFDCSSDVNNICLYDEFGQLMPQKFPKLRLGNISASRDWGHAKDYVEAMRLIMKYREARDWIVSTNETYTIEEFLVEAFRVANLGLWRGYVVIDKQYYRPSDVPFLKGDSSDAKNMLGWRPTVGFKALVKLMVNRDMQ